MSRLRIKSVGPGATIQDAGRFGFLRYGVTSAGPMDWVAFETANRALDNSREAAAIEIGPGGILLDVDAPMTIACAGGGFEWRRADIALAANVRITLKPGEGLRGRATGWGSFAYCAVSGGIDVPEVMGSHATHTRAKMGGLDGRMLASGDVLAMRGDPHVMDDVVIQAPWLAPSDAPIRIVLGPQDDHFTSDAIATLETAPFTLTAAADRMAYKFDGPKLSHKRDFNIVSDGIALGAIQVAGDGQLLVLMADRQPTGGYTKIAHVARVDIGRLAQLQPGQKCRFAIVDVGSAAAALRAMEDDVSTTPRHLAPMRHVPTAASLLQSNLIGGVTDGQ